MIVRPIEDKQTWNAFLESGESHTFLQSWEWGEFQKSQGETISRFGIYDDARLISIAFVYRIQARRGTFLFCPHGPIMKEHEEKECAKEILQALTVRLIEEARKNKCHFIRISPILLDLPERSEWFSGLGFRHAPVHLMHPERAWILDVRPTEEELLAGMRKTTRYSIKKAEKDGVTVWSSSDKKDLDRFLSVYKETVSRQHFVPFSRLYFEREFDAFASSDSVRFFFADYEGETIAVACIVYSKNSGFYHHGASTAKTAKIPAAYLLQWRAIQETKKRGCAQYNFWGIAPDDAPNHPWAGLSLFKKGFGGQVEEYVHAQDLPLHPMYWLTYSIEWLRRKKRRL